MKCNWTHDIRHLPRDGQPCAAISQLSVSSIVNRSGHRDTLIPMSTRFSMGSHARGIILLIAAVSCFGAVDGLSKLLVDQQSFGQIMVARYLPSMTGLLIFVGPGRWPSLFKTRMPLLQIARGFTPLIIGGLMVVGVRYLPLAEATVILFAGPFIVVAMSGWMLGERVSAASWIGVAVGFLAVVIVARPGFDGLSQYTIFPLLAAVFYALLQLLSRQLGIADESTSTTVAWTLLVGCVVTVPLAVMDWPPVSFYAWILFLILGAAFGMAQYLLAQAFSHAPANVLAPFTYFQIVSAAIFGLLVFQAIPDFWTFVGTVLIVAAGAYVFGQNEPGKS